MPQRRRTTARTYELFIRPQLYPLRRKIDITPVAIKRPSNPTPVTSRIGDQRQRTHSPPTRVPAISDFDPRNHAFNGILDFPSSGPGSHIAPNQKCEFGFNYALKESRSRNPRRTLERERREKISVERPVEPQIFSSRGTRTADLVANHTPTHMPQPKRNQLLAGGVRFLKGRRLRSRRKLRKPLPANIGVGKNFCCSHDAFFASRFLGGRLYSLMVPRQFVAPHAQGVHSILVAKL